MGTTFGTFLDLSSVNWRLLLFVPSVSFPHFDKPQNASRIGIIKSVICVVIDTQFNWHVADFASLWKLHDFQSHESPRTKNQEWLCCHDHHQYIWPTDLLVHLWQSEIEAHQTILLLCLVLVSPSFHWFVLKYSGSALPKPCLLTIILSHPYGLREEIRNSKLNLEGLK
jgi:hypothetical protein